MRGNFSLFKNANGIGSSGIGSTVKFATSSAFSTSSAGGGSGGGRGRGGYASPIFSFVSNNPGKADSDEGVDDTNKLPPSSGIGHGRGKAVPSTPYMPSFNSVASKQHSQGIGRGRGGPLQQPSELGNEHDHMPKKPIFLKVDEATGASSVADSVDAVPRRPIGEKHLPETILNVLTGSGRGVPTTRLLPEDGAKVDNRHLRHRQAPPLVSSGDGEGKKKFESGEGNSAVRKPKMSREDAVRKAVGILSQGGEEQGQGSRGREDGVVRGRGRGRARGRGRGRGVSASGRGRGRRDGWVRDGGDGDDDGEDDEDDDALFVGNDEDGENVAKTLGPVRMEELTQAFEEMSYNVLPDPEEDEGIEALDTNLKIELEPEYLFGDLERNPDIDEKPPMSLHEALEKMKPFLMAYEGIENQEEWEEVVKETMERVPLLKEIVDHYCGPDRVTAKQQHGELERVAKTLPASVPNSVKRFTDRAVLSLQSNAGWGFDRKCQFMDKLVDEFSKSCK